MFVLASDGSYINTDQIIKIEEHSMFLVKITLANGDTVYKSALSPKDVADRFNKEGGHY